MFIDKLIEKIIEKNNPTVLGLDPKLDFIPSHIKNGVSILDAIFNFNKALIDELYDIVPAVKPQLAYYEMYGIEGLLAFDKTVKYAKEKGLLVIADGKRNDIGTTAEAYSKAYLENEAFNADALTVTPYLGIDGIKPFIDSCKKYDRGIFVLVKTSNKSSGELQDLILSDGQKVYEKVASLTSAWGSELIGKHGYSSVGAVVGATYPNEAIELRQKMPNTYFLIPGYGAQGATADDAVASFDQNGLGGIVNASRSIMCAYLDEKYKSYGEEGFAKAARAEGIRMRDDLNKALERKKGSDKQ